MTSFVKLAKNTIWIRHHVFVGDSLSFKATMKMIYFPIKCFLVKILQKMFVSNFEICRNEILGKINQRNDS
jgi:hypothetical protein